MCGYGGSAMVQAYFPVSDCNQIKESNALSEAELKKARAKLADAAQDESLLCAQVDQLKDTIKMFSAEKEGLLQQKSGDKETYMEELRVLRGALNIAQSNTEAALTQVSCPSPPCLLLLVLRVPDSAGENREELHGLRDLRDF